ncbi:MAG TPA: DUF1700 domain-containing protein [Herpetosiphonaceae bacterium]
MASFNESYFAELESELGALSAEERDSILRELRSHTEDAQADGCADADAALRLGLPTRAQWVGRQLRRVHAATQREARKRRSMLAIGSCIAIAALILSFIWPWLQTDGRVVAFVLGGLAAVCAVLSLVGIWVPKPRLGRWLVWSGSAGLTLIGVPPLFTFGSFYLICGPLLLVTGMQLKRA